jgi:redox-sensitive bicupin YhaK (pirin superfamily)
MTNAPENHSSKAIKAIVEMPYHAFDQHSGAHMLRTVPADISPFIGIDSFTMPQPFFGPHPHAGMSAVTLLFPEAEGGFINRDSLGSHNLISPGDLHWTQAGAGMMHEEVPSEPGKATLGLQVFVNLSRANKQADPVAFHVDQSEMPTAQVEGGNVRVVAGKFDTATGALQSPICDDPRWLTQVKMLDVTLAIGASLHIPVKAGDNAFFVIRSGTFQAPDQEIPAQAAIIFEPQGAVASLQAGSQPLRGVFFSGTPIDEPIFPGGSFMGNNAQDIEEYTLRYKRGEMGQLSKSF